MDAQGCLTQLRSVFSEIDDDRGHFTFEGADSMLLRLQQCSGFLMDSQMETIRDEGAVLTVSLCSKKYCKDLPMDIIVSKIVPDISVQGLLSDVMRLRAFLNLYVELMTIDADFSLQRYLQRQNTGGRTNLISSLMWLDIPVNLFYLMMGNVCFRISESSFYLPKFSPRIIRFEGDGFVTPFFSKLSNFYLDV
ncbi:22 kDa protein [polyscias crinivirus 1]|nr:22 kDa protein [polyscias crinivirus 1]